jgi:hypothetical protein
MREEIQTVVEEEGWTKAALTRMRKVDSFIRESQRLTGVGARQSSLFLIVLSLTSFSCYVATGIEGFYIL